MPLPSQAFAPAKINLYLHVTGRLPDGYHTLDSLIAFADIGDEIFVKEAPGFTFEISGPMAHLLHGNAASAGRDSTNLIVKAVWAMAEAAQKSPAFHVTLKKNLPIAAGLGGGSSDAAIMIKLLMQLWDVPPDAPFLPGLLFKLGADVPACFYGHPAQMSGRGEIFQGISLPHAVPIVLINPNIPCPTGDIFKNLKGDFSESQILPALENLSDLVHFLQNTVNDLTGPAIAFIPEIYLMLDSLSRTGHCLLARLSGSGATCFGIYKDNESAEKAATTLRQQHPGWWIKSGFLNSF